MIVVTQVARQSTSSSMNRSASTATATSAFGSRPQRPCQSTTVIAPDARCIADERGDRPGREARDVLGAELGLLRDVESDDERARRCGREAGEDLRRRLRIDPICRVLSVPVSSHYARRSRKPSCPRARGSPALARDRGRPDGLPGKRTAPARPGGLRRHGHRRRPRQGSPVGCASTGSRASCAAARSGRRSRTKPDPAFLLVAWARVKGNKGARTAGVDGWSAPPPLTKARSN
jgi:hypothetical protein